MTQRSAFQIQILEKLGAPLISAVAAVSAQKKEGGEGQKLEAERVAALLSKTVQVSIGIAASMDLKDADGNAIRLALAAMAGPLVAGQYRLTGKIPGDADIKRMIKTLEAVLTFSDNFAPAAQNTTRLENLEPGAAPVDESQIHIQYIGALVPVVNVIAAFPFGRPESKLVQEVSDRLVKKATSLGEALVGDSTDVAHIKGAELRILKALAAVYVQSHQEGTDRLMAMDEQARAKLGSEEGGGMLSMDPVWDAFERRAGMIEIIGRAAAPGDGGSATGPAPSLPNAGASAPQSPVSPFATPPKPVEAPPQSAPPPAQEPGPLPDEPPAAPPAAPEVDSGQGGGAYNPMGFFKSKDESGGDEGDK